MKIAICSSMAFAKEMLKAKKELEQLNFEVIIQHDVESHALGIIGEEDKWRKIEIDPFKTYFGEIGRADAILVLNYAKKGIEDYVGGNTLIEMAFAYVQDKKIFMLNPVPNMSYSDELHAFKPIILHGDFSKIK